MKPVNLRSAFARIDQPWQPRIAGEVNDMHVKLVKLQGEFVWHHHDAEDELFLVISGRLLMRFRDREVWIEPGEFLIVPKGVEHLPIAPDECEVVLFERAGTLNTGTVINERTVSELQRVATDD
ncbi:MAG TPA: cupin domain-containing protein [Gemmatimonadaceae bacterium]|nr:cupin domain-containing protein [Gemmatimonadaceae bacterium]